MTTLIEPGTTPSPIAETQSLVKEFNGTRALDGVDLVVPYGAIVGLIGPSGCGKTTLVRHLTGIATPTSGEVRVFGADPRSFPAQARSRFGYMPQMPSLYPNLSVWRNMTFMSSMYGMHLRHRRHRLTELLELVGLEADRRKLVKNLSGGGQRRLMLAATLVHEPELLFLDEPTAGVDPLLRARLWDHFRELRDRGITLIVPTQYVGEAAACDLVAVMSGGRLLTVLPPDELRRFAYGGDVIALSLEQYLSRSALQRLAAVEGIRAVSRTDAGVNVVVDDAERDRQHVIDVVSSLGGTGIADEPFEPTYEDIFVAIVERDRALHEADAA
ncbi:MAG TPA: ABC transporter ATP-binding protein [Ilumatobacteraceae bacterium]|nr:ABC transporter ATP-binding protein [Ilumatobacteraceae bacterium]